MSDFGWLSVLPPVAAIVLAVATRRIYSSLAAGIVLGVAIYLWPDATSPASFIGTVIGRTAETHLWPNLIEAKFLRIIAFTLLIGAMVGVVQGSGGMRGALRLMLPLARTRAGGQLVAWLLGLILFIDDYANTLLIGPTMRPLFDRLRISREKLAYIVDSTSAPVAGLAIVSTWVAGEMDYIQQGFEQLGVACNPFGLFLGSLPFRFYEVLALLLVPLLAVSGRDFGPMLRAERLALRGERAFGMEYEEEPIVHDSEPNRWYNAVLPIGLTIALVLCLLALTSTAANTDDQAGWRRWAQLFGQGDSYIALLYGGLLGMITAMLLALATGNSWDRIQSSAIQGALHVVPALAILWLARTLGDLCGDRYLHTGDFLGQSLRNLNVPAGAMPLTTFLVAAAVSLATGTSWGTMGLITPLAIGVTYGLLQSDTGPTPVDHPLLLATIGAVLAGAIFGDHCSPVSDTTILSSRTSMCDHIQHVRTQLPYAFLAAALSCPPLVGVGWGLSPWMMTPLAFVCLAGAVWLLGKPIVEPASSEPATRD